MRRKIHKEDIMDAGLELMFENGYNATGIKDITDKVGIPKGSFYNHFSSKEEFGVSVVQQYCDNGTLMYKRRLLDSEHPPLKRFELFFDYLINNYEKNVACRLGCIMGNFSAEMADVNEEFRVVLDQGFEDCQAVFEKCLKEAKDQGDLKTDLPLKTLSSMILNSWHGAMIRMKSTANSKPLKDFKKVLFKGIFEA